MWRSLALCVLVEGCARLTLTATSNATILHNGQPVRDWYNSSSPCSSPNQCYYCLPEGSYVLEGNGTLAQGNLIVLEGSGSFSLPAPTEAPTEAPSAAYRVLVTVQLDWTDTAEAEKKVQDDRLSATVALAGEDVLLPDRVYYPDGGELDAAKWLGFDEESPLLVAAEYHVVPGNYSLVMRETNTKNKNYGWDDGSGMKGVARALDRLGNELASGSVPKNQLQHREYFIASDAPTSAPTVEPGSVELTLVVDWTDVADKNAASFQVSRIVGPSSSTPLESQDRVKLTDKILPKPLQVAEYSFNVRPYDFFAMRITCWAMGWNGGIVEVKQADAVVAHANGTECADTGTRDIYFSLHPSYVPSITPSSVPSITPTLSPVSTPTVVPTPAPAPQHHHGQRKAYDVTVVATVASIVGIAVAVMCLSCLVFLCCRRTPDEKRRNSARNATRGDDDPLDDARLVDFEETDDDDPVPYTDKPHEVEPASRSQQPGRVALVDLAPAEPSPSRRRPPAPRPSGPAVVPYEPQQATPSSHDAPQDANAADQRSARLTPLRDARHAAAGPGDEDLIDLDALVAPDFASEL